MTDAVTQFNSIKAVMLFERKSFKSIMMQIKLSEDLVNASDTLTSLMKRNSTVILGGLIEKAVDKFVEYLMDHHKVESPADYSRIIQKLPAEEIYRIKKNICLEVIEESQ